MNWMDDKLRFPIAFGCLPVWDRGGSGARHTVQSYWGVLFLAAVLPSLSHPPPPLPYKLTRFLPLLCFSQDCRPRSCRRGGIRWFRGNGRRREDRALCIPCSFWKTWHWPWRTQRLCRAWWHSPRWPERQGCSRLLRCAMRNRSSCCACLSCTSGWELTLKRRCFLGLERVRGWWW